VREQFRIADGEELGFDDPPLRGHSFEFRINGEDPGRNFLPAPGSLLVWDLPSGPGVRVDGGFVKGDEIGGNFDSLLAKLIVTGADRQQAIERSRRALREFQVDGIATALTFHRVVVEDPAFAPTDPDQPFVVHTRWIETEFNNTIEPYQGGSAEAPDPDARTSVVVEVDGKRIEVSLPESLGAIGAGGSAGQAKAPKRSGRKASGPGAGGDTVAAPMQGTVVKVAVDEGEEVAEGDLVVVLEAMKMEQPLNAHRSGIVSNIVAEVGSTVSNGAALLDIVDG